MRKIIKYNIIADPKLETKVNNLIKEWWQPYWGTILSSTDRIIQAMVLYNNKTNENKRLD